MDNQFNPVDELIPVIAHAIGQWKATNNEEVITKFVHTELDKSSKTVLMKLLGFDIKYNGQWELDHCNGRNGNSAAGDYIRQQQSEAIKDWLSKVELPSLTPAIKKELQFQAQHQYVSAFKETLRLEVQKKARNDVIEILEQISSTNNVEKYLAVLKLVHEDKTNG
jgi:hypothetical protein